MLSRSSDESRVTGLGRSQSRAWGLPHRATVLALLMLATSAHAWPVEAGAGDDLPVRIQAILSADAPAAQVELLVALGPESIPHLFEALVTLPPLEDTHGAPDSRRTLLFEALRGFEFSALRGELLRRADAVPGYVERKALLQLVRRGARAEDTELILQLAAPAGLAPLHAFFIAEEARQTLAALFRRDPPSTVRISLLVRDAHPSLVIPILEATSALPPLARISILVDALRDRPAFAPQLLGWLSLVHGDRWDLPERDSAAVVRPYLDLPDASVVAIAARALGVLEDHGAVEPLVALLAHQAPVVREAAHDSLRALTGLSLPLDAARWKRWYEEEASWRESRAATAFALLSSENRGVRAAALQEIGRHRLDRHVLAHEVVDLVTTADEATRELACVTLRELGSPVAIRSLIVLLDTEGEARSVRAAHACLQALTGMKLPPDPQLWSAAYELRRLQ